MSMLAWVQLKVTAWETNRTIYAVKRDPLQQYVAALWRNPATMFEMG